MAVKRVLSGAVLAVLALVAVPRTAGASCAAEPTVAGGIAIADVVFVGTVVDTENRGRYATFAVHEIWKGTVASRVDVRGGPPDPGGENSKFVSASTERSYVLGERYVVTAFDGDSFTGDEGVLGDNNCSGTTAWDESLAQFRPADAVTVAPADSDSPPYLLIVLTTVLVAGGCLYLLFRRGSLAHRARRDDELASRE